MGSVSENPSQNGESPALDITVEFSGGLEILFSNKRKHKFSIPSKNGSGAATDISDLVRYLCDNVMEDERKELFLLDDSVRPGILVLINDADWELEGEEKYQIQPRDNILFVSTLHGG
ncbi:hypothetical protein AJ80_06426 [Polytolypa hystricis UAMH7299]|uniref:Ubiquitin-related modifier 1 n=1 Tax=Polytolypa hystricis (strain UAMH7299) TaxID=1447883 RepID=A0A2B7XVZ4_POLH7|nr:hypothetical protein AJ80_06426 [Polytolypa hystricis UAMH7299]